MSSTSFNIGYDEGNKKSSRVLKPPGGGHTDIFGSEPVQQTGRICKDHNASSIVIGGGQQPKPAAPVVEAPEAPPVVGDIPLATANGNGDQHVPVQKPLSSVPENTEVKAAAQTTAASTENQNRRTRVPPGGFSTKLW